MRTLNLGILAHVDAGKTSLTERLLYDAGVIDALGSVDAGSTLTDSLALERERGITIKSAVVSFVLGEVAVNLLDTPGHPDFIAEVERVLNVLDGAVLVISAVEGVQAQTRVLMRTLRRLRIPTLLFVNKIDRSGADAARVLHGIADRLDRAVIAMGSVVDQGGPTARFVPWADTDAAFRTQLIDLLAEHDDAFLAAYVADETMSRQRLRAELARQSQRAVVYPVLFGSAITGAGVDALRAGITELLPATEGDACAPAAGTVFKVDRGRAGEKIAYARMFAGTVRVRDRVQLPRGVEQKVTAIAIFDRGASVPGTSIKAGQIGALWGLGAVRIGDPIGVVTPAPASQFAPPTLETVVEPAQPAQLGALHSALARLAEQDPLIDLRHDGARREISVSLYGEVQKEVIQATLAGEFGIHVGFRETTTICIERPVGAGAAVELIGQEPNPFLATVGLRIEPGPLSSGVQFRLGVELGSMPLAFFKAVEETVIETLREGLHGWPVLDCLVTMTRSGYWARQSSSHGTFDASMSSTAGDFRHLTPLVLMAALQRAGTVVHEPLHRFRLEIPGDTYGSTVAALARLRAGARTSSLDGASCTLEGEIPAAQVYRLQLELPGLTRGDGVLESRFARYEPVGAAIPTRPRLDHNPLDREQYLANVTRRG